MTETQSYQRFSLADRIEHWVLTLSFSTLAITGLVQKYAGSGLPQSIIEALGGIENTRLIHRFAAILLMLEIVYHLGVVGYRIYVRRVRLTMFPGLDDISVVIHALQYNLGLREDRPQQGRYTFEEKAEYWAVVWGTIIMVITGFMLWNPIATARILPGDFIPAAKTAHGAEAVLATLAIVVWHLYGVHVKVFNRSIFSGSLTEEEMLEEHPLELADIKAGVAKRPVEPKAFGQRRRVFQVIYAVLTAGMLAGIFAFVTFEETAIETVPPAEQVVVFVPLTPTPFPTPLPTPTPRPTSTPEPTPLPSEPTSEPVAEAVWEDVAELFQEKCGACHSEANALGGLNLSSYEAALEGGESGSIIQPGDADASSLVTLQEEGGHPGQFSEEELAQIRRWIEAGALELSTPPESSTAPPEAAVTWADVADLFQSECGACHSDANTLGGLNLGSAQSVLEGGNSGPAIEPGDPDASPLMTLQEQGGHPGQFTEAELDQIRQWIVDGALE